MPNSKRTEKRGSSITTCWANGTHVAALKRIVNETRNYQACLEPAHVSKTQKEWPFLKTIGLCKQLRILRIRDECGNDITPGKAEFLKSGTRRQVSRVD